MGCAMAKSFNPLAYSKKLKEVGFTESQAETLATAQAEIIDETLVTKEYLDHRLAELETRLEYRLTMRLGAIAASAIAIMAAIVKFIP